MTRTLIATLMLAAALPVLAQDAPPEMTAEQAAMMQAYQQAGTPGPQHAGLAKTTGTYDLAIKSWMGPDAAPTSETGTAVRSMILGDRVMTEKVEATMHGQPFTGHGMTGYDNVTRKYWSTWNDSMSTGLMVSEGTCDDAGACNFTGSWHDPVSRQEVSARMTTKWTSPTVEVFEMYGPGPDGKEHKMMEMTYTKR